MLGIADAGQLQELRRVEGAAAEDHLRAVDPLRRAALERHLDAGGARRVARRVHHDPRDERVGAHRQVRAPHRGAQVRLRGRPAAATMDVAVEGGEALLLVAVDVGREFVAGLLDGLEEGAEEGVVDRTALEDQGAALAAPLVGAGAAVLHLLEVRQAVRVVPRLHARVRRPALVVERVAALEDHPVDAAGAAEHLAAAVVDAPSVHVRLGLRRVHPVEARVPDREGQRRRHVDVDLPRMVGATRLEDEHRGRGVLRQAVGERGARGAAADDDVVVPRAHAGRVGDRRPVAQVPLATAHRRLAPCAAPVLFARDASITVGCRPSASRGATPSSAWPSTPSSDF